MFGDLGVIIQQSIAMEIVLAQSWTACVH